MPNKGSGFVILAALPAESNRVNPLLLSFLCCFAHTVQPLGHAFLALCRTHVQETLQV